MAPQPQLLSSSLKVPDTNGEVVGAGSQHIGSQGVEAQRVDLFCVAWRGPGSFAEPLGSRSPTGFIYQVPLTCEHSLRCGENILEATRGHPPQSDPGILPSYGKRSVSSLQGQTYLASLPTQGLEPSFSPGNPGSLPTASRCGSNGSQTRSITAVPF